MKKSVYIHILLVMLLLAVPVVSSPDFDGTLSIFRVAPFLREFLRFALVTAFFYLNLFYLLPKIFETNRSIYFSIVAVCFILVVVIPPLVIPSHPIQPQMPHPIEHLARRPQPYSENNFLKNIFAALLPFLFGFMLSAFLYRSARQRELVQEKTRAELDGLKYQLQPHFLFNVLNSIYSLTITKSDDAPNAVLKLSSIMRYIVSESNADLVPLDREISYIKDFIALQLLRTDENLSFSYNETGDAAGLMIAPMILINFIENAFKYGYSTETRSEIKIFIDIKGAEIHLKVINEKVNLKPAEGTSQIGLRNSLQRLKMIYPKSHSVEINGDEKYFCVDLKISNLSKDED